MDVRKISISANAILLVAIGMLGISALSRGMWVAGWVFLIVSIVFLYGLWKKHNFTLCVISLIWFIMPFLTISYLFSIYDGGNIGSVEMIYRVIMFSGFSMLQVIFGMLTMRLARN